MRKLFRFKYEPCNGTCYAYCRELQRQLRQMDVEKRKTLVGSMVEAHNHLCDNPAYSFGVDKDEEHGLFISHFRTPESTDLFSSTGFEDCVKQICETVLAAEVPQIAGNCVYGDNGAEDLGKEILKFCEDEHFALLEKKTCSCEIAQ